MDGSQWHSIIQSPDVYLRDPKTVLLKFDPSSSVGLFEKGENKIIIKEHKMRSLWKGVKSLYVQSRGYKSLQNAKLLESLNIPSLKPIAYVDKKMSPLKKHSFFIYEYIEGINLKAFVEEGGIIDDQLARLCVELIYQLKKHHISHGDLKIANFIISSSNLPWLIDIHSLQQHHSSRQFYFSHRRDIGRFIFCFRDYLQERKMFIELFNEYGMPIDNEILRMKFPLD